VLWAGELVGEVRLRRPWQLNAAAEFSWSLFGLVFLGSLSIVAVACLMCHHWLARVRELARNTRALAAGDVDVMRRLPAAGELRELQEALADLGITLSQGLLRVQDGFIDMAVQMVDSLERRGVTPPGHGERTSRYVALLADRLGLLPEDLRELELAARLHDMGKMWVRPSILNKSAPLDSVERESLRNHPDRAARLLECLPSLNRVARTIRHHHEKYDGNGFPHGLRGDRIPLGSRILAIGDAYDQLTSCNIYGEPLGWPDALDKLREDRGVHFDPWLLDLFEEEIRKDPLPSRVDQPVMISTEGVVPYKMAEESRCEPEEDMRNLGALEESEVELMADDGGEEEEL
jgi:HD-GYP domain-containing protein (c-di-GMP phosphodiesterase class II)